MNRPWLLLLVCLSLGLGQARGDEPFRDRFVWIFGWNLETQSDVEGISRVVATAGAHGLNGAVVSFGLDTLCRKSPGYFDRLAQVKSACERNGLEVIRTARPRTPRGEITRPWSIPASISAGSIARRPA